MKKNNTSILLAILMGLALVGALWLVRQNQETRRGAYFAGAKMMVLPNKITGKVGDELTAHFWVDSGLVAGSTEQKAKVQNATFYFCYDSLIEVPESEAMDRVTENKANGFDSVPLAYVESGTDGKKCMMATVVADNRDRLKSGSVDVATVKFKGVSQGTGKIQLVAAKSKVSGDNAASDDMSIEVQTVESADVEITGSTTTNDGPALNMILSFAGVTPSSQCTTNWPLQVSVKAPNGTMKTFTGIKGTKLSESSGLAQYKVQMRLGADFNQLTGLAVFVKGPKHLQVKYGVDKQAKFYDQAGGQIVITNDPATSTTYDFSGYPLLAGDVTGASGKQDGVVDGRDFVLVKTESFKRTEVSPGQDMAADLNGNCKMESLDVTNLMLSLAEKQEQLY